MKAEINKENRHKFFAQYWGQRILRDLNGEGELISLTFTVSELRGDNPHTYLELKPIHEISGDEALKIFSNPDKDRIIKNIECGWLFSDHADILRSKGYAIPWMGLSVVQLEQAGWIKLTPTNI